MKTLIVNQRQQTRVPFLRGILVGSLQDAGLSFDRAYRLATQVREQIGNRDELTTEQLRELVEKLLRKHAGKSVCERYRTPQPIGGRVLVHSSGEREQPFSRARHQRYLMASGLRQEVAEPITELVYDQLLVHKLSAIDSTQLAYLTWLCLHHEVGARSARRYLRWYEFRRSGLPLLILIGGAVGAGKSTLATELAHRLGIVRVQSTDMLREVMRMTMPDRLLPVLHRSSFDAWQTLPNAPTKGAPTEELVVEGFKDQAALLAIPCEAVLQRAVMEGVSLILEGVHAYPGFNPAPCQGPDVITVHVILGVLRTKELQARLRGRGRTQPARQSAGRADAIDAVWKLQSHLLAEADRCGVPIITNEDRETAKHEIIKVIGDQLAGRFKGTPESVFGSVAVAGSRRNWRKALAQSAT